jgi:hypothetical protein
MTISSTELRCSTMSALAMLSVAALPSAQAMVGADPIGLRCIPQIAMASPGSSSVFHRDEVHFFNIALKENRYQDSRGWHDIQNVEGDILYFTNSNAGQYRRINRVSLVYQVSVLERANRSRHWWNYKCAIIPVVDFQKRRKF